MKAETKETNFIIIFKVNKYTSANVAGLSILDLFNWSKLHEAT